MSVEVLKQIWPEWQVEGKPLGKGSFGVVYKAVRRDHGVESYAAIKVISIPADPSEVDSLRSEGLDMNATRTYLQGIVNDFVSEIQLMESLKGVQNIVSVEDYKVVEKSDEIGWDIYIRMELLTSFNTYICDKKLTEEEVIKLGCDICTALEICAKRNIIHRDIKPENIFINDFGYFKLGDFGIARKMENMTGGLSQKGSPNYMAPEVTNGGEYDARVDTYSLGIVLYRLLNGNRLPFLDSEKQLLNPNERRLALDRRLCGEKLPAPCDASPAMADLILRACAYDPNMRFSTATEMKKALQSVANGTYKISANKMDRTRSVQKPAESYDSTWSVRKASAASNQKSDPAVNTFGSAQKKKSKLPAILSVVLVLALLVGAGAFFVKMNMDKQAEIDTIIEEAQVLADAEDFMGAIAKIEDGLDEYSDEDKLQDKLDEYLVSLTDQQITTTIADAESLASNGDYEGAIELLEEGLADHPDNDSLQNKITEYTAARTKQVEEQAKEQALADAQALADSGDYVSAIALIKNTQETQGDDVDYQTALNTYSNAYKTKMIASADALAAEGDYIGAIAKISEAEAVLGENTDLSSKLQTYENEYVKTVSSSVQKHLDNNNYNDAIKSVIESLEFLPGNSELMELKEEVERKKPIDLEDLILIDSYYYEYSEELFTDSFGDVYDGFHWFSWGQNKPYAVFNLRGEFSTFNCSFVAATSTNSSSKFTVGVYLDDELVYTLTDFTKLSGKKDVSIDVTNVTKLEIRVYTEYASNTNIAMVNAYVKP